MIWILTVMMWYEGEQTRSTYLQELQFISDSACKDYLFTNKVMLARQDVISHKLRMAQER